MNKEAEHELIENAAAEWRAQMSSATVVPPPLPAECCPTESDFIVHTSAPPPVTQCKSLRREPGGTSPAKAWKEPFEIEVIARNDHPYATESASWMGSLCLHALLIAFLALLLAPADFGGRVTQRLIVTFRDDDELQQQASFEVAVIDTDVAADEPEPEPAQPPAVAVPLPTDTAIAGSGGGDRGQSDHRGGATGGDSARGSFFGIEQVGHKFVYVVDMSGSMRGRRFQRATDELVRSVRGLREDQKFYVLLFNGSTTQMFGESNLYPAAIAATHENKRELEYWVKRAFEGGSTDPRGALKIALRMRPSAIFMLSDGEFDDPTNCPDAGLLGGDGDAFSIVAAAAAKIPIHAIAFEDPQSCRNMKRLAEMTRGEYRFTQFQDDAIAKQMLKEARQGVFGDIANATRMLRRIVAEYGSTESGWKARKELAAILHEWASAAFYENDLRTAVRWFTEIVEIDPEAIVTADIQQELIGEFVKYSRRQLGDADDGDALTSLAQLIDRFPNSKSVQRIIDPVANGMLAEARVLSAQDEALESLQKLEEVIQKYPQTDAAKECARVRQQVIDDVLDVASGLRQANDDVAAVRYLRNQAVHYQGTQVGRVATQALEELAVEMLSKVRHAAFYRDRQAKGKATRQIKDAFDDDPLLQRMENQFNRNERAARELLRRTIRLENTASLDAAAEQYGRIASRYPRTLAATKARDRLKDLRRRGAIQANPRFVGDSAVLLKSMLQ